MALDDASVFRHVDDKKAHFGKRVERRKDSCTIVQVQKLGPVRLAHPNDLKDPAKVGAIEREFTGFRLRVHILPKRLRESPLDLSNLCI